MFTPSTEWEADCLKWRGHVLTGRYAHWCGEYDDLPVDETCENEWPCACRDDLDKELAELAAREKGGE